MVVDFFFFSEDGYKTLLEKEKVLVTSIFFFSNHVFKSLYFLVVKGIILATKKLDSFKLKAFADDNLNDCRNIYFFFLKMVWKWGWKRRKCWLPAFSAFPIIFSKGWLINWMVFYAAFNSISVISRRQLTLFMLSWVSPVLGWALKCFVQGHSHENSRGSSAARTQDPLFSKAFTSLFSWTGGIVWHRIYSFK